MKEKKMLKSMTDVMRLVKKMELPSGVGIENDRRSQFCDASIAEWREIRQMLTLLCLTGDGSIKKSRIAYKALRSGLESQLNEYLKSNQ